MKTHLITLIKRYLETPTLLASVIKWNGRINPLIAPVKMIATIISIATGGSAGKEGPAAQIGGSLTSTFAGMLKLSDTDRKKLVVCGISAGFSSVFYTLLFFTETMPEKIKGHVL